MKNKNTIPIILLLVILLISINGHSHNSTTEEKIPHEVFNEVDTSGIVWLDPREEPFSLSGFEWIKQDNIYRRLPVQPDWEISEAIDYIANYTAGGQVRFITDSKTIHIKVQYRVKSGKDYVLPSGKNGFDLYVKNGEELSYVKATKFAGDSVNFKSELFVSKNRQFREFTLNFPLYNEVELLQVGIEEKAVVKAPPVFSLPGKIVIYGTSITQGGSVSRPGMLYSNMLSRKLDAQFINLGFSGNGKGEPELARLINQIKDISLIILDYEANANETIQGNIGSFIKIIREERPNVPILLMSKIRYVRETDGSDNYKRLLSNRDFQKKLVHKEREAGDKNIYFLDGSEILGEDYFECFVDGVHPTDLGAYRIYNALYKIILEIFPEKKTIPKY